jgi:hypothetical protein
VKPKKSKMSNSKMFLVTILSITTVLLTTTFAPLASAQYDNSPSFQSSGPQGQGYQGQQGYGQGPMGQGYGQGPMGQGYGQGPMGQGFKGQAFHGTRTAVSGTYTNSNMGVQITLPTGWSGFEMKSTSGNAKISIAPGGISTQGQRPSAMIGISIMPPSSTLPNPPTPRNAPGITCTNSTTTNTVNSLNLNVITVDCTGTDKNGNPLEMKSKTETAQTTNANIIFNLRAYNATSYDSQVTNFDNMVSSLQLSTPTNTTPTTQTPTTTNPTNPTVPTTPGAFGPIPKWVKGIFGMYAQGQLSDNDLVQALQFLIKEGIIKVQ